MAPSTLEDRVSAIERVTALFPAERLVYLILTTAAVLLLVVSAISLLVQKGATPATLTLLFGSSGLITISFARLLRMWDRALDLLSASLQERD
jgi:hypothetical protein